MNEEKNNKEISLQLLNQGILHIQEKVDGVNKRLDDMTEIFVQKSEFNARISEIEAKCHSRIALLEEKIKPIRAIVYGSVGFIGTAILAAIIQSILRQ